MDQDDLEAARAGLSDLQLKCLEGFWNRRPAKQIAADLGISEGWVNKNLMTARRQLNVSSSADAAAMVFGSKPGSIKNYYYQETAVPGDLIGGDQAIALGEHQTSLRAASERPLLNRYSPLVVLLGIILVALGSIVGVTLTIDAGDGMYQLWKASGH